jgi:myo-inositol 2-dehydrogenase/D-chiro-inositol 1-dehydrogenase
MIGGGLIGAGRIGTSHAQILAERVSGARLAMVADPRPDAAASLADRFGAHAVVDPLQLIKDNSVEAVVIARQLKRMQT